MPKASITLPNGTTIEIDGTLDEIQRFSDHIGRGGAHTADSASRAPSHSGPSNVEDDEQPDIAHIVSLIKDCDEAETIETRILNQTDVLNRVLLCLWVVHRYVSQSMGLTSGDIEKITDQLGVKISTSNASKMLAGRAKSFVSGDAVRKQGTAVHYRINRRGMQAFETIIQG